MAIDDVVNLQPEQETPAEDRFGAESESAEAPIFQNLYDLDEEEKEKVLKEQNERFDASVKFMGPLSDQMIKNYKKYRSIAEPLRDSLGREINDRANIFVPYPWAVVESAMPRLAGRLPRVHAFPRKDIEQEKVDTIQDLILYSLDRMGFLKLQQAWIRQFEIYGWSPLVYFWRNEKKSVFSREKSPMGGFKMAKKKVTIWDDFAGRVIDVFDAFFQPGIDEIGEDNDWFIFREWLSKKDILARIEGGIFYPEVRAWLDDNAASSRSANSQGDRRDDRDSLGGLQKDFQKHSYGRYEVRYTLESDRIIATIDGKILARCGDNPNPVQEKSIINLNLLPMINEPVGISTIEALAGLPDKLNALSNARLDNISLQMNKVFIADRTAATDFDNIVFSAGNVILTDNIESIKELEVDDTGMSSEREIITTKEEIQFVSGISDYIVGVEGASRLSSTATGVSSIIREANAKFALKLAAFEAGALRKLVEMIHAYNMMYMSEEKRIHILGPKGYLVKDVKLEDILVECDFLIEPGSSAPLDQLQRRESLTNLLDRVIQLPQVVDINKYMKELLEAYDFRNVDEMLIKSGTQIPEYQDVKLAEAENIALSQGQEIELKGNDFLHIQIHQRALQGATPEAQEAINSHTALHAQRSQAMMAQAATMGNNQLFGGGQNGSVAGPGAPGGQGPAGGNNQPAQPGTGGLFGGAGQSAPMEGGA